MYEHVCTCVSMCEHAVIYRFGVPFRYAVTCLEPPKTLFQHLLAHHDRSQSLVGRAEAGGLIFVIKAILPIYQ